MLTSLAVRGYTEAGAVYPNSVTPGMIASIHGHACRVVDAERFATKAGAFKATHVRLVGIDVLTGREHAATFSTRTRTQRFFAPAKGCAHELRDAWPLRCRACGTPVESQSEVANAENARAVRAIREYQAETGEAF